MPSTKVDDFLALVRKSGLVETKRLDVCLRRLSATSTYPAAAEELADVLVREALLTKLHAKNLLAGKWSGFFLGNYKILEHLGTGGMGTVFLAEHRFLQRQVALKVLPRSKSRKPSALERFFREAKAIAAVDHPNLVRAHDIDQHEKVHFLVMEYVDGPNLHEVVKRFGPMSVDRAVNYVCQTAHALQHILEIGLIHRDVKPGNLLVDRYGTLKLLDLGLARFFEDDDDNITENHEENALGTADYMAPEQVVDSHAVDIRADIYSLGCTLYFMLSGSAPFEDGTYPQKLIWHQTRSPTSIKQLRPEVPSGLVAVLNKMMHRDFKQRYATPNDVVRALKPWHREVPPPSEKEMPKHCPATRLSKTDTAKTRVTSVPSSEHAPVPASRRVSRSFRTPAGRAKIIQVVALVVLVLAVSAAVYWLLP